MTKELWDRRGPPNGYEWVDGNRITYGRQGAVESIAYAIHFKILQEELERKCPNWRGMVKQACEFLGKPVPEHVKK